MHDVVIDRYYICCWGGGCVYLLVDGTSVLSIDGGSISKTVAVVQVSRVDDEEILAAVGGLLAHVVQERREVAKVSRVRRLLRVSVREGSCDEK